MPLTLPSASSIDRAMHCDGSVITPGIADEPNVYSTRGDLFHDFVLAIGLGVPREDALRRIALGEPGRILCETFPVEEVPKGGSFELAVAFNVETGVARVLGEQLDRGYEAAGADRAVEFVGSADRAWAVGPVAMVLDWKTGFLLGKVLESWQLMFLAFCIAEIMGLDQARIAYVIPREGLPPIWKVEHLDALELAKIRGKLLQLAARLKAAHARLPAAPELAEGSWCRWCRAFQRCDAKTGMIRAFALGTHGDPVELAAGGAITPAIAGQALITIRRYDEARKALWAQLAAYAKEHPIDRGDGYRLAWAPGRAEDKITNPQEALDYLATEFGVEIARAAASTSKSAIEEAVGDWAREHGHPIGKTQAKTIETLRSLEAITKLPGKIDARIVKVEP